MSGLLSYDYGDVKSGKIKLRKDGTIVPEWGGGGSVVIQFSVDEPPAEGASILLEVPKEVDDVIYSCFPLIEPGKVRRRWVCDPVIAIGVTSIDDFLYVPQIFRVSDITSQDNFAVTLDNVDKSQGLRIEIHENKIYYRWTYPTPKK